MSTAPDSAEELTALRPSHDPHERPTSGKGKPPAHPPPSAKAKRREERRSSLPGMQAAKAGDVYEFDAATLPDTAPCVVCGQPADDVCSTCKTTFYCSPECQMKDWPNHKKICKPVRQIKKAPDKAEEPTQPTAEQPPTVSEERERPVTPISPSSPLPPAPQQQPTQAWLPPPFQHPTQAAPKEPPERRYAPTPFVGSGCSEGCSRQAADPHTVIYPVKQQQPQLQPQPQQQPAAEAAPAQDERGGVFGTCSVCRRPADKVCGRCESVVYCSASCQKKDWLSHRRHCERLRRRLRHSTGPGPLGEPSSATPDEDDSDGQGIRRAFRAPSSRRIPAARCIVCGRHATTLCGGCRAVSYCGPTCEKEHWLTHRQVCRGLQAPPPSLRRTQDYPSDDTDGGAGAGPPPTAERQVAEGQGGVCGWCGRPARRLCGGCEREVYCSLECQSHDWPHHRIFCSKKRPSKRRPSEGRMGVAVMPSACGPCAHCGRLCDHLCGGCKAVFYCSKECQHRDWATHRAVCSQVPRRTVERPTQQPMDVPLTFPRSRNDPEGMEWCRVCDRPAELVCPFCQRVFYCSPWCQHLDRPRHQHECFPSLSPQRPPPIPFLPYPSQQRSPPFPSAWSSYGGIRSPARPPSPSAGTDLASMDRPPSPPIMRPHRNSNGLQGDKHWTGPPLSSPPAVWDHRDDEQ
ncbi:unnamed protein product [Vitrella brassicaformis CCMP3155]|uniref:MYND-type domain-containing protein n=1 Tax=Vitrella brassicaformis (strain CCMP3155) TaxID=1169540 RepID=A0A0G4F0V3_VITBC|nr:unnamed protein product [Vitrella brassicaformis CCMP3155]|eukprot:CEM05152.1 unnamed protein product [Vitrella brassicaformis CCMP3155]